MSENNHKEWASGLVALHHADLGSGAIDLVLRTETNLREYVSHRWEWSADVRDCDWGPVAGIWGEAVWIGSREAFQRMRDRAKTPVDLLRAARGDVQPTPVDSTVVIFGEEYVKASDSRAALAQAEATIEALRQDLRDAQMQRGDSVQCYAAEADSARAEVRNLRSEIDRLRARMDDIPGLLEGVLGFRPYEITAEGFGGSPPSLPKGRGLVAYTVETKYPDGRAITKATLACQE